MYSGLSKFTSYTVITEYKNDYLPDFNTDAVKNKLQQGTGKI